jgi:diguanylate cyclase (GGDEF)-like protein
VHRGWDRLIRLTEVQHADQRVARQGRIVVALLFALIALALTFLPFAWLLPDPRAVFLGVTMAVVPFVGIAQVIRRGHVMLGSVLMLLTYMAALVAGVLVSHQVGNGPQFVALAVTMAGATLGVRHVLLTLGMAIAVLGLMEVLAHGSTSSQVVSVSDLLLYAVVMCSFTAVVSAVTAYAVRQTLLAEDEALRRSKQLAAELRDANRTLELRVAERTAELQDALRSQTQLASRLAELSVRDALTGLYNRRHLDAEIVRMFEESLRYQRPLCVALLDLDSFKAVNDRFGHDAGDEVLRRVSRILVECTRGADLVARYGGEELALVMPDTGLAAAHEACERIRQQVELEPWDEVRAGLTATVSVGLAQVRDHDTVWHLVRDADRCLYAAKAGGRNLVVAGERVGG